MIQRGVDLAEAIGITYRQLSHWTRMGYVTPEGGTLPGSGKPLKFNEHEARILCLMARLVEFGLRPDAAADYARQHVDLAPSGPGLTIFDIDGVGHLHVVV